MLRDSQMVPTYRLSESNVIIHWEPTWTVPFGCPLTELQLPATPPLPPALCIHSVTRWRSLRHPAVSVDAQRTATKTFHDGRFNEWRQ